MAVQTRLDECLSIREGRLFVEDCDAVELARRFGTPVHVISEDQLRRNARRYRSDRGDGAADAYRMSHGVYDRRSERPAVCRQDGSGPDCEKDRQSDSAIHDYGAEVLGSEEELGWFSDAEAIYASASDHRAADLRSV